MSVSGHEAAAEAEDRKAESDPCLSPTGPGEGEPCWSAQTERARREAAEHRRLAAEHRNAAAIEKAEREACANVSEEDRVVSPFSHREDILSVQPLSVRLPQGGTRDAGAVIVFRKVPRLTAGLLQKIIDCHLARNAAFGFDARELAFCPLNVNPLGFKKLKATVTDRADGFAVELRADDEKIGQQIWERAQGLVGAPRCLRTPVVNET